MGLRIKGVQCTILEATSTRAASPRCHGGKRQAKEALFLYLCQFQDVFLKQG